MGTAGSYLLRYLRLSRFLGIFPIIKPADDDAPRAHYVSVLFTLLSVSLGLSFTVEMAGYVHYTIRERPLSRILATVPSMLAIAFSEGLIRASSLWFRNDLSNFLALTSQAYLQKCSDNLMRHFWMAPTLYSACALVRFIGVGLVFTDSLTSTFKTGSDWDRLLALWMALDELFHDGALISALWFVVIFGRRAVSCLDAFCEEILQHNEAAVKLSQDDSGVQSKCVHVIAIQSSSNKADRLIDMFADLKTIFGIYSKIGGTFAFALVIELGMLLFYLVYLILFSSWTGGVSFWYIMATIYCILSITNLCIIAEVGHQMASQLASQQEKLADFVTRLQEEPHGKHVKKVAKGMVAWSWEFTALGFFPVNRSLVFKVFAVIMSYTIFVFQLRISNL